MSSNSGGYDAKGIQNRGRGGHGKAFDASRPNSSDKTDEKFDVKFHNSVVNPKECDTDILFKTASTDLGH